MNHDQGELFSGSLMAQIKERFHLVDHDSSGRPRLYFDNAGGSFRLKAAVAQFARVDAMPDCSERIHAAALYLQEVQAKGTEDIRMILNARGGSVYASLTASGGMFDMVRAIAENVQGTNMVTTVLEHPSSFDAMKLYAERSGRELRVAAANPISGGVDVEEAVRLVDRDTVLLSVTYASNISGAKLDVREIVRRARAIKADLFIVVDAVQHAPHGLIDLQEMDIDGINIAPYKFFGCRGSGISWLSDRTASLPHHKLAGKKSDYWDLGSAAPWQFAAVTEIVNYVSWLGEQSLAVGDRRARFVQGMHGIERHERALLSRLLNGSDAMPGLRALPNVDVFVDHGDLTKRDLIVAMGIKNLEHAQAVREYEQRGVIVYERVASSLYSRRMLHALGIEGAIRVSPLHCHSTADIDHFLKVTRDISEEHASKD